MVKETVHFLEAQQLCVLKHDFDPLVCLTKAGEDLQRKDHCVKHARKLTARTRRHEKVTSAGRMEAVELSMVLKVKKMKERLRLGTCSARN